MKTKVIFRKFSKRDGGAVIALFPGIAATVGKPETCESYMHIGQHSAANLPGLTASLKLAWPSEYADLEEELTRIGYDLDIRTRATRADYAERVKQLAR